MIKYLIYRRNDALILLSGMLICGLLGTLIGKDLSWDMANYHFYNPYAYLHHRWLQDFWPISYVHMNLSPSADLLGYFLIQHFSAWTAVFIAGAVQGANFYLLFKIAQFYLAAERPLARHSSLALGLAFLGIWQPCVLFAMGTFQNDLIITIFLLGAFYCNCLWLKKYSADQQLSLELVAVSGLQLGIAAGLKMTAVSFVFGSGLALMCLPMLFRDKFKVLCVLGVTTVIGLLLANGYWMLNLWQRFHNPFYPFFNALFNGHRLVQNQMMTGYNATGWLETLWFPFALSREGSGYILEFQFAIIYLLLIFLTARVIFNAKKILTGRHNSRPNLLRWWFFGFFIFSYLIWEQYFGVTRYVRTLAMLSPLFILLLLYRLLKAPFWYYFAITALMTVTTFYTSVYATLVRLPHYDKGFFNVVLPANLPRTPDAIVLMGYADYALFWSPRPQTYLIPYLPSTWRYVGIPFTRERKTLLAASDRLKIKAIIASQAAHFYLLTSDESIADLMLFASKFGLQANGPCEKIYSDRQAISHSDTLLCPVVKSSSAIR